MNTAIQLILLYLAIGVLFSLGFIHTLNYLERANNLNMKEQEALDSCHKLIEEKGLLAILCFTALVWPSSLITYIHELLIRK